MLFRISKLLPLAAIIVLVAGACPESALPPAPMPQPVSSGVGVRFSSNDQKLYLAEYFNPKRKTVVQNDPVLASPDHLGIALPAGVRHFIRYHDGQDEISVDFLRPPGSTFMKPSVDTMLVCHGLKKLFASKRFERGADVGTGSGFIAKYMATKLGQASQIVAIDIDPKSKGYLESSLAAMPANVTAVTADAFDYLKNDSNFDLLVSNPPYVPIEEETKSEIKLLPKKANAWEGTAMMSHLIEEVLPKQKPGAHLVMVVPSLSLKAKYLVKQMREFINKGGKINILHQQEVVYKAWFVGGAENVKHLIAKDPNDSIDFGNGLKFYEGATLNQNPREKHVDDGRLGRADYYWQMIYILDFSL